MKIRKCFVWFLLSVLCLTIPYACTSDISTVSEASDETFSYTDSTPNTDAEAVRLNPDPPSTEPTATPTPDLTPTPTQPPTPTPTPEPTVKAKAPASESDSDIEYVYITDTGECYHRLGCGYLHSSCIKISKEDAIRQGYRPCSRCKP